MYTRTIKLISNEILGDSTGVTRVKNDQRERVAP